VQPAIGIDCAIDAGRNGAHRQAQFLFVGRLLYWKGLHLVLRALADVRRAVPDANLKIVGQGSDRAWLESVAREAGIADAVEWIATMGHDQVQQEFRRSTALVFPSLHDSGGMVVLEALAAGAPVVCLDLGGPGAIVTPSCGVVVGTRNASEAAVIAALSRAMTLLATDAEFRARLAANAVPRARESSWDGAAEAVYSSLDIAQIPAMDAAR
jgi:glycosyltransferase involved in cell wall biosynthesis